MNKLLYDKYIDFYYEYPDLFVEDILNVKLSFYERALLRMVKKLDPLGLKKNTNLNYSRTKEQLDDALDKINNITDMSEQALADLKNKIKDGK
jgi:hypothetical protein